MKTDEFKYRGKIYSEKDIAFIKQLIAQNPNDSRRKLSQKICVAWKWTQRNGALCDQICRSFMLELHRNGLITLPPARRNPFNSTIYHKKPSKICIDQSPIHNTVAGIQPIEIVQVRRKPQEPLCNSLIEQYHYLKYTQPVGEHLKYIVYAREIPLACMTWSSAPRHIGCRDRFIGWTKSVREKNLHYIAYNSRYLVLPWVKIKCFASFVLAAMIRQISADWEALYHHPLHYLETFVDTELFSGTCYRASNWIYVGETTGRGKNEMFGKVTRSIKAVYGYPLSPRFREKLCKEDT